MNSKKAYLPTKNEVKVLAQSIVDFEASASCQPFSMEQYFQWLCRSPYFKYADAGGHHNNILEFGSFQLRGNPYRAISVKLYKDHLIIGEFADKIAFATLEGAIKATQQSLELLFEGRNPIYVRARDLFAAKAQNSGLEFCVRDDSFSSSKKHIGYIKVKIGGGKFIDFLFNENTPEKSFEQMAKYAIRYITVHDKYKKYNCEVNL